MSTPVTPKPEWERNLKSIVWSADFGVAAVAAVGFCIALTDTVAAATAVEIYQLAVSVLSIVFAVYFAALAIIVAAPDDDFVRFLEEEGDFTRLVWAQRYCLRALFVALTLSIGLYVRLVIAAGPDRQGVEPSWLLTLQMFVSAYALLATLLSAGDCINFAQRRAEYARRDDKPANRST